MGRGGDGGGGDGSCMPCIAIAVVVLLSLAGMCFAQRVSPSGLFDLILENY